MQMLEERDIDDVLEEARVNVQTSEDMLPEITQVLKVLITRLLRVLV